MSAQSVNKILITGGSGSIGKLITPFLLGTGHEVTNYDKAVGNDIFDLKALASAMNGKDALIHLVAIPHPAVRGSLDSDYWKMNFESLKSTFHIAADAGVKRIIFPSTGCVYGFWGGHCRPDQFPLLESNTKPTRDQGLTVYGETKLACEAFLEEESEKHQIRTTSIRIESIGYTPTVTDMDDLYNGFGKLTEATSPAFHLLASSSVENFQQALHLALHHDINYHFAAFNISNDYVHWSIDVQKFIHERYPGIPNHTRGNQSLTSNASAKEQLGFKPYPVRDCYPSREPIVKALGEFNPSPKDKLLRTIKQGAKKALTLYNSVAG